MRRLLSTILTSLVFLSAAQAQEAEHPVLTLTLDADLGWIDDGAVFLDQRGPKRKLSREEARVDRGALLDHAIGLAAKEGKLVLWYVPRISEGTRKGVQMYRAPVLDVYMRQVVFCDADVHAIVRSAFVPVRMVCDEALAERFDIRPLAALEPAIVFLDGEGKVVHYLDHIRTFNAHWFASLFGRVLDAGGIEPPADASPSELMFRGAWEAALAKLEAGEDRDPVDADLLAGCALRRLRRVEEAATRLRRAQTALIERLDGSEGTVADKVIMERVQLELGGLFLQTGARGEARELLAGVTLYPEAEYLAAWAAWRDGDDEAARRRFQTLADEHPDTLAGRRALANVTLGLDQRPLGATFSGFESVGYLPEAAYVGLPRDTSWAGEGLGPRELAARGVRFLLAQQRSDGGYREARYAYWPSPAITPNAWTAISALALTALQEYREILVGEVDLLEIDNALARGERYLLDPAHVNRGENEEVYADAFRLLFLAGRARTTPTRRRGLIAEMQTLIGAAEKNQERSGFFSHEYPNAFCTAAMLWALLEAQDVGAAVPEKMMMDGVAALISARSKNGAYAYMRGARGREISLKDAAGRMPICEAVLLRRGHGNPARLEAAIENYWEHLGSLRAVRLNDFHSDGELAGFFFFHDVFFTCEALELLPESQRHESAARFVELLQEVSELDGSYLDSHEFGRSYGTAMALLALRRVGEF